MKPIEELIKENEDMYLHDLDRLISRKSIHKDRSDASEPFGRGVREAFDEFIGIGKRLGFDCFDEDGYACGVLMGEGEEEEIAILGHLDVVDAGDIDQWTYPPYSLTKNGDMLYGRGVNDDKGPLLAALYAMFFLKENNVPPKRRIRLIAGGAEETTWEGIHEYFKRHEQPIFGFSPDGDFPIVNGEAGILKFSFQFETEGKEIELKTMTADNRVCDHLVYTNNGYSRTYRGIGALSRHPERGENAIWDFIEDYPKSEIRDSGLNRCIKMLEKYFYRDDKAILSGLHAETEEMGETSLCICAINMNKEKLEVKMDLRYPNTLDSEFTKNRLLEIADEAGAKLSILEEKKALFVSKNSEFIHVLADAYEKATGNKAEFLTKKGASYARALERGVAFGASFPGETPDCHMPNEHMPFSSLKEAIEIYYYALYGLTSKV